MPTPQEIEARFWKALRSDRTVMLGIDDGGAVAPRPMTALLDGAQDAGPLWIFTAADTALAEALADGPAAAIATFAAKGHDLFASLSGTVAIDTDRAVIDRLWNPFVAAWYEGGKDDPKLVLLRFDPEFGEVWLDKVSLLAGLKLLMGADPKKEYRDKVAKLAF